MHAIERNNKNTKKGKDLLEFINGQLVLSVKNTKILCGYSENTGNDVILDKVSLSNRISKINFNKKDKIVENYYITVDGFQEILEKLTQKDKIQNAKLALDIMVSATKEVIDYNNEKLRAKIAYHEFSPTQRVEEIREIVGTDYRESKPRWKALYDELDRVLDESIRHSHQRYTNNTGEKISILNYIKDHTNLLPLVHDIALKLYNN